jgi:hypothetical protein
MEALALRYGVTPAAIRHAVRRLTWRHVDDAPPEPPAPAQPGLFDRDP